MARVDAQGFADKWAQRTAAASQDYAAGIRRVTQAPGAKAAAKKADYVNRVNEQQNKWAQKVAAVSLTDWQEMAATKGATNLATGVQAAKPKMQISAAKLLSTVDAVKAQVKAMPGGTLDQRIARAAEFARRMNAAYRQG
jgi:hypothetical protein